MLGRCLREALTEVELLSLMRLYRGNLARAVGRMASMEAVGGLGRRVLHEARNGGRIAAALERAVDRFPGSSGEFKVFLRNLVRMDFSDASLLEEYPGLIREEVVTRTRREVEKMADKVMIVNTSAFFAPLMLCLLTWVNPLSPLDALLFLALYGVSLALVRGMVIAGGVGWGVLREALTVVAVAGAVSVSLAFTDAFLRGQRLARLALYGLLTALFLRPRHRPAERDWGEEDLYLALSRELKGGVSIERALVGLAGRAPPKGEVGKKLRAVAHWLRNGISVDRVRIRRLAPEDRVFLSMAGAGSEELSEAARHIVGLVRTRRIVVKAFEEEVKLARFRTRLLTGIVTVSLAVLAMTTSLILPVRQGVAAAFSARLLYSGIAATAALVSESALSGRRVALRICAAAAAGFFLASSTAEWVVSRLRI